MKSLVKLILNENSLFRVVALAETAIKRCSNKCRSIIKNGPNAQKENSVCIANCKINSLSSAIASLKSMKQIGTVNKVLDSKIRYLEMRRLKEIEKKKAHISGLNDRRTTTPAAFLNKPTVAPTNI